MAYLKASESKAVAEVLRILYQKKPEDDEKFYDNQQTAYKVAHDALEQARNEIQRREAEYDLKHKKDDVKRKNDEVYKGRMYPFNK
jgi:hypothetical protein